MNVKKELELVYKSSGGVYNIVPLPNSTLKAYEISKEDYRHLIGLAKTYGRAKNHIARDIVENEINSCVVVNLDSYPLPGFVTSKNIPVVNLFPLGSTLVTDYTPFDIYSLFLYSISMKKFVQKEPFKKDNIISVYLMLFSIFMRLYGKKSGLIGSYSYLIPRLRFLILLYVSVSMFGLRDNDNLRKKLSNTLYMDYNELKLDYDFSKTRDFLKSINENNIISLSEHTFSKMMIDRAGVTSLPIFEDVARFYSTLISSTVYGAMMFSGFYSKANSSLYPKIVNNGLKVLKRI